MTADPPFAARPIGLDVSASAKALDRAFNAALGEAGGTLPVWLILRALKQRPLRAQLDLARVVGIGTPTLTRHLDGLERAGLVTRVRDPDDRRMIRVELTAAGEQAFHRLRVAARAFDQALRDGLSEDELELLRTLLARLVENAGGTGAAGG
jgi:MarR family transcriptional regulator, transcriptional regulator for hemolysin